MKKPFDVVIYRVYSCTIPVDAAENAEEAIKLAEDIVNGDHFDGDFGFSYNMDSDNWTVLDENGNIVPCLD